MHLVILKGDGDGDDLVILKGDGLAALRPLEGAVGAVVHLVEPVVRAREPAKNTFTKILCEESIYSETINVVSL